MGPRIRPVPREELSPEAQTQYDSICDSLVPGFGKDGDVFRYKDDNGGLTGPHAMWMVNPEMGRAAMALINAIGKLQGLPQDAKETVILAVGGHFQSAYELYAHHNIAEKRGLLSKSQIESIKRDQKPADLSSDCSLAYDVAKRLCSAPGPLPADLWQRAVETFGLEGTVAVVQLAGLYASISMTLNALDMPAFSD